MLIDITLPIITILGTGFLLLKIVQLVFKISFNNPVESFIFALILGTGFLLIPWTLAGIQGDTFFFRQWPVLIGLIGSITSFILFYSKFKQIIENLEEISYKINTFRMEKNYRSHNVILSILIGFLFFDIVLYQLFVPIRGYDALWIYIPEALWYWRTDTIPIVDLLNFRLTDKEPGHILLFSYSLYTTGALSIQFLPLLFLIGWAALIYLFTMQFWKNQTKALFAVVLFMVSPFIHWIVNFWMFYQDIFIAFYFSATLYCLLRISQSEQFSRESFVYMIFAGISMALAFLTKLSGWTLLFIVILLIPFRNKARFIPTLIILVIGSFLILRTTTSIYWGMGVAILGITLLLLMIIWRTNPIHSNNLKMSLAVLPIGFLLGSFWLVETLSRYAIAENSLIDQYFSFQNEILLSFPATDLHSPHYLLESAQGADFLAIILFLLVGNVFVVFWLLPKLRASIDKESRFLLLWILSFFMIWISFHGQTSVRYLTPILVPVIILVAHGTYKLVEDLSKISLSKSKSISLSILLFVPFLAFLSYYFPIPLEVILGFQDNPNQISDAFLQSAFFYYTNTLLVIIIVSILSIIFLLLIKNNFLLDNKIWHRLKHHTRSMTAIGLIVIVLIPVALPLSVLIGAGGNIEKFERDVVYHNRLSYQEIAQEIISANNPTGAILVVNMPGLVWRVNQPVLDLYLQGSTLQPLFAQNVSDGLFLLQNPLEYLKQAENLSIPIDLFISFSFDFVVVPTFQHLFYSHYIDSMYYSSFLYPLLNQPILFRLLYENEEFQLFQRIYNQPQYHGIVDIRLRSASTQTSIFGKVLTSTIFTEIPEFQLITDFSSLPLSTLNLSWSIQYSLNSNELWINQTSDNFLIEKTGFTSIGLGLLPSNLTINSILELVSIELIYSYEVDSLIQTNIIHLESVEQPVSIIFESLSQNWLLNFGNGLKLT